MYFSDASSIMNTNKISVADPDPGSGAFLILDPGSGIGFFRILDPESQTHIFRA
jgi:hypothetical protein